MKFTIERSKWLRGEGSPYSSLLRQRDQKKCCLGFMACALGYTEEQILEQETPGELVATSKVNHWPDEMIYHSDAQNLIDPMMLHQGITRDMMDVNDTPVGPDTEFTEEFREASLKKMFNSIGIEVEFVE